MDFGYQLATVVFTIGAVWALNHFFPSLLNHKLSKDLESHKNKNQEEIEKLKAQLQKELDKNKILQAHLQEKRIGIIAELYKYLNEFHEAMINDTKPLRYESDKAPLEYHEDARTKGVAFIGYYRDHKIFFDKNLCDMVDSVIKLSVEAFRGIDEVHRAEKGYAPAAKWDECYKKVVDVIPPIKREIEDEFRRILGVNDQ